MLQIYLEDIAPVLQALTARNWTIYLGPREVWRQTGDRESGQREVFVQDPDGYLIMVAHNIGERPLAIHEEGGHMLALWVKVRVKPEGRERFLKAIEVDALGSERDEPGCLCFNVLHDQQTRTSITSSRSTGRGGAGGASGRAALRRLARRRGHAGRPAQATRCDSTFPRRPSTGSANAPGSRQRLARPRSTSEEATGETTMTARVPMVSLEHARELGDAMGMPARRTQSEAFRTLANNPGVARVAYSQLMQLLENNKFDTRLRELMIMRIGWVTGSAYEWTQHWRVRRRRGSRLRTSSRCATGGTPRD